MKRICNTIPWGGLVALVFKILTIITIPWDPMLDVIKVMLSAVHIAIEKYSIELRGTVSVWEK